jgi:DNA replication protein DnaC
MIDLKRLQEEEAEAEHRKREQQARARLEARLTKPEHKRCRQAALEATTLCALLLGPTGVGKTEAAHYLVRHARACWLRAIDLASAERRYGLGRGEPEEFDRAKAAKVLVIDDVGHERDTSALFDVLDHRYSAGRATVVTTGLTRAELTAHLSAAVVRRIVDQHCKGPDGTHMPVLVVDCFDAAARR